MKCIKLQTMLSLLLLITMSALFTCEKVPDYCGKGQLCNPDYQFCFAQKTYDKCGGSDYNPFTEGCIQGVEVGTRCSNESIVKLGTPCNGYTLTTGVTPIIGGSVTHDPADKTTFAEGEIVTVSAFPEDGYLFAGWAGAKVEGDELGATYRMSGGNPLVTIVATFKPIAVGKLITDAFPEGSGEITRVPDEETYRDGEKVVVTASALPGYVFDVWSGASSSREKTITVTMDESKTLVAMFKPVTYNIRANANPTNGGTVFVNGNPAPGDATIEVGAEIEARATAADGYEFTGWSGAGAEGAEWQNKNQATIRVTGDGITITANFRQKNVVTGGAVTPRPGVVMPGGGPATPNQGGTLKDSRDGQTYRYVKIGSQTWMAENLNYNTRDGEGSWCNNDDPYNCTIYGRLYDWATAMDIDAYYNENMWGGSDVKHRGVCPVGWHLPSRREWGDLAIYAGGTGGYGERGGGFAGANLKSTSGWYMYNEYNTDAYGFSALPGGDRSSGGSFDDAGGRGYWWTAEENSDGLAYYRLMYYIYDYLGEGYNDKSYAFSVRCVRD